jgi:hypothetical protein
LAKTQYKSINLYLFRQKFIKSIALLLDAVSGGATTKTYFIINSYFTATNKFLSEGDKKVLGTSRGIVLLK